MPGATINSGMSGLHFDIMMESTQIPNDLDKSET